VAVHPEDYIIVFSSSPGFQIYFFFLFWTSFGQVINYFAFWTYLEMTGVGREICDADMPQLFVP
jgi:hypothetical protein